MIHVHCTISSIKWDISLLTSESPHINIPIPNEPSHPQPHHFVRATLPAKYLNEGEYQNITEMEIFPVLPCLPTDQSNLWVLSPLSCLIPSPNSNLNGISDEYQNQIQVSQDKHGLDCILNEKRRILPRKGKRIFCIFKLLIKKTFDKVIGSDSRLIIGFENENKCFPVSITIINACWKEPGYYKCFLIKSRMLMTFWRLL